MDILNVETSTTPLLINCSFIFSHATREIQLQEKIKKNDFEKLFLVFVKKCEIESDQEIIKNIINIFSNFSYSSHLQPLFMEFNFVAFLFEQFILKEYQGKEPIIRTILV